MKTSYYKKVALIPCVLLLFCSSLLSLSRFAYLVSLGDSTITPIDVITNTVYPSFSIGTPGDLPGLIALTPDCKTAFVNKFGTNEITRVDLTTNTVVTNISTGAFLPADVVLSPDAKTVWVPANFNLIPIDTATNTVGTPITIAGSNLQSLAITSDGIMAYVTSNAPDGVYPVNLQTGAVGTIINTGGLDPFGIAITPDNRTAYVANFSSDTVTPINLLTNTAGTPIPVGNEPNYVAITPDGSRVYVTNFSGNSISVISTATNTVIDTIVFPAGSFPNDITIDISGTFGLVSLFGADSAQKFLIPSDTLSTIYPDGDEAYGVAICQVPFPPTSFRGVVRANIFLDRTEYILEVTIGASTDPVQFYRIFRNGVLVLETSNLSALFCLGTSISVGGFSIASVLNGIQSEPIPLIIG